MKLLATDLDNTLLYSFKHAKEGDICVEKKEGKDQGFMTKKTVELLKRLDDSDVLLLPITTRSVELYKRINWNGYLPKYAIVSNGAVLLEDGVENTEWKQETERLISPCREEMQRLQRELSRTDCFKRCNIVDDAFLFAYTHDGVDVEGFKEKYAGNTPLKVECYGKKLYFFPQNLNKGTALERFLKRYEFSEVFSAGDSDVDLPMLNRADTAFVPSQALKEKLSSTQRVLVSDAENFAEFILKTILNI